MREALTGIVRAATKSLGIIIHQHSIIVPCIKFKAIASPLPDCDICGKLQNFARSPCWVVTYGVCGHSAVYIVCAREGGVLNNPSVTRTVGEFMMCERNE